VAAPTLRREADCERLAAETLRAQWRMFERVSVRRRGSGGGLEATIHLNPVLVRGAAAQRSLHPSAATAARHAAQRLDAIAACVDRANEQLPAGALIEDFVVLG